MSNIIQKLYRLTPSQLYFISDIIDFELSFLRQSSEEALEDYINLIVPTGNMEDGMIWDSMQIEKINIARYRKSFGSNLHCALRITSNNLHPVYNMEDILLISKKAPRDGDTVLLVNTERNRAYIRRLHLSNTWILSPLNNFGVTFQIDVENKEEMSKWIIFGHVLAKTRL